jgi:hypothetical protein
MAKTNKTGTTADKAVETSKIPAKRAATKTTASKSAAAKTATTKAPAVKTAGAKTSVAKAAAAGTAPKKTVTAKTAPGKTAPAKTATVKTAAVKTVKAVAPKAPVKKLAATKAAAPKAVPKKSTTGTQAKTAARNTAAKADEGFSPELVSAMLAEATATEVAMPLTKRAAASTQQAVLAPPAPAPSSIHAARQKGVSASSIRIFQIYFDEQHKPHLDRDFEAYDNSGDKSPLLEFNVFDKLARSGELEGVDLWGALSWKFGQKFGMSGAEFKREIQAKPGYDVYFCNPHPSTEAIYHNLWLQGETAHPNFIMLCKEIFEVAGLPTSILTEVQPSAEFASANYFVATPAFWDAYLPFIKNILELADKKLSPKSRAMLYSTAADHKGLHANVSYIPFVVERLFSVFLKSAGKKFRAQKIVPKQPVEGLNVHLKLLSEMKDVAHRTKSLWLAACWVNYRNLYLSNIYGADWAKKYIRKITPNSVTFSQGSANITTGAPRT